MAKGKPRTATAASAILQQASETQTLNVEVHSEPAETRTLNVEAHSEPAETKKAVVDNGTLKPYKPAKKGVNAGLKQGETRITCIFRQDQSHVLHAWAKTTGHTFREVCLAMADRYIEEVIRPATSGDRKLKRGTAEPPETYADLYDATPDMWEQFFE